VVTSNVVPSGGEELSATSHNFWVVEGSGKALHGALEVLEMHFNFKV
jgi:hypothetical protein